MKLSRTTKLLLRTVFVIYGCLVALWLFNAMTSYGKRTVTERLYEEKLALREEVYLAKDKVTLPGGRDIDEEVTQALLANGIETVKVQGHGTIIGLNLAFFCTMGFQILNFAILLILLMGVLWAPLMRMLDERAARVQRDLDSAAQNRQAAEKLLSQRNQMFAQAQEQRAHIMEDTRVAALGERGKILAEARREAQLLVEAAKSQLQTDLVDARDQLQREVATLSIQLAQAILSRELSPEDHSKLIEGFIAQLNKRKS